MATYKSRHTGSALDTSVDLSNEAYAAMHTHANKPTLDKFGESAGVPTFAGQPIGSSQLTVSDTTSVDLSLSDGNLSANVIRSTDAGNTLQIKSNGLFASGGVSAVNATLLATGWTGTVAPYAQILSVAGMTDTNHALFDVSVTATDKQMNASINAVLVAVGQTTNYISFNARGDKPTVDIPITILIMG